ncbi:hypothetical protein L9F63_028186, partial [Diploptera punctata]
TTVSTYQHKTASLVANRMGFFPPHPQLPQGYQQQHQGYSSTTSASSGRLVAFQQLHAVATTSTPASVISSKTGMNHPQSPWSGFMVSCRPHNPYHPRYVTSETAFSNGHLSADAYLHSNSSSIAGSEEDSMDKSEEGEEEEDDEVKVNSEKTKEPQQQEKKRNPYSIEELLKKPDNTRKSPGSVSLQTMLLQPPCGLLVDKPCTCSLVSTAQPPADKPTAECNTSVACAESIMFYKTLDKLFK